MQKAVRALLLTDVVDSTRLVESLGEDRAAEVWAAHDEAARELLPAHRGLEIDKTDGFLMLFESSEDGAAYALAYHRALAELSDRLGVSLQARAGLHLDQVVLRENPPAVVARGAKPLEVDGLAKPLAARVMSLARGGQTLLTASARGGLRGRQPEGTELQFHGHWRLKGVAEPVPLFELGVRGESPFAPPEDAAKAYRVVKVEERWGPSREVPHALPAERDAFVGRVAELAELARRLDAGARFVTVLGPAGTGKTRLVTRYAWTWMGDYPGGAWFCDLSEARSLDGLASAVARALDVPLGKGDPTAQLGHLLAGRGRCLLVLDNFEQVVEHAETTVGHWLERAKEASVVVTSRELLNLPGEDVMIVEPLPVDREALELFELRARAKKRDFSITEGNRAAVQEVVRLLDGLPLAIELAAARSRVLSPAQLLDRMKDRFALLAGARGPRERQATLRAAIDWSWDLLEPWERAALAQSSVFEGGFTLEAAEAVLDLSAFPEAPWALDAVQALVDKSLLRTWTPAQASPRHDIDEPYFGMYVSIHEYAAEKLRSPGALGGGASGAEAELAALTRHGRHFARFGTSDALEALEVEGGAQRRRALELELDNLVAACRRALERGDGATAVATYAASWAVLFSKGPYADACALGEELVRLDSLEAQDEARAVATWGRALRLAGRVEDARARWQLALGMMRESGDLHGQGRLLASLAVLELEAGRPKDALPLYEEALEASRRAGDRRHEGLVLGDLAIVHWDQSRREKAQELCEQALAIHRELGARRSEAHALACLGVFSDGQGHALYEQALAIAREVGDRRSEGQYLTYLSELNAEDGRLELAQERCEEALAINREVGDRRSEALALGQLGSLLERQGCAGEARKHLERSAELAEELGYRRYTGQVRSALGAWHVEHGELDEGLRQLDEALSIHREVGDRVFEGATLGRVGVALARRGASDEAREAFESGQSLLRELGAERYLGPTVCLRGQWEAEWGRQDEALACLREAQELADRTGAGPDSELGCAIAKLRRSLEDADDAGEPGPAP